MGNKELVQVHDIISDVSTTVLISKGKFPRDQEHPEYVEIHQIEGAYDTVEEFEKEADKKDKELCNYIIVSPEDAKLLFRAFASVLS